MSRVLAWIRWGAGRLGLAGSMGIVLIAAALVGAVAVLLPAREEAARLEQRAARRAQATQTDGVAPAQSLAASLPSAAHPQPQMERIVALLPGIADAPDGIVRLQQFARDAGLALETGEYRLSGEKGARLFLYEITLPIRGTYPQIRGFLQSASGAMPALSIDDVAIRRESARGREVEARVRLTLHLAEKP